MENPNIAGPSRGRRSAFYEVNNNETSTSNSSLAVRKYAKYEYKKLQSIVAAMGFPANLKRKQLLAIIVAKKMKKDYMIPAILKEVDRQRNERKKMLNESYDENPYKQHYKPRVYRTSTSESAGQIQNNNNRNLNSLKNEMHYSCALKARLSEIPVRIKYMNKQQRTRNDCINMSNGQIFVREIYSTKTKNLEKNIQQSYVNGKMLLHNQRKSFSNCLATDRTTTAPTFLYQTTSSKITSYPLTNVVNIYKREVTTMAEQRSFYAYPSAYMEPPVSSQIHFEEEIPIIDQDIVDNNLDQNINDLNLDAILDYVMGDENESSSSAGRSFELMLKNEESRSDAIVDHEYINDMNLSFHGRSNDNVNYPLNRVVIEKSSTTLYYSHSLMGNDTSTTFNRPLQVVPNSFEISSNYNSNPCVYQNNLNGPQYSGNNNTNGIPDYCLLQPEPSVSYAVPNLYFSARNNSAHNFNNYMLQENNRVDLMSTDAYSYPQIKYNIMLPLRNGNMIYSKSSEPLVELKSKMRPEPPPEFDVDAPMISLEDEETRIVYNSFTGTEISDLNVYTNLFFQTNQDEHEKYCNSTQISCPFLDTKCYWFSNSTLLVTHIRTMHPEKIVRKKVAEFHINYKHLELINGTRIIQEFNNRLFLIATICSSDNIFITVQELCESVDNHTEKMKVLLCVKLPVGIKSWNGDAYPVCIPISTLWNATHGLIVPMKTIKTIKNDLFLLYIQIG